MGAFDQCYCFDLDWEIRVFCRMVCLNGLSFVLGGNQIKVFRVSALGFCTLQNLLFKEFICSKYKMKDFFFKRIEEFNFVIATLLNSVFGHVFLYITKKTKIRVDYTWLN